MCSLQCYRRHPPSPLPLLLGPSPGCVSYARCAWAFSHSVAKRLVRFGVPKSVAVASPPRGVPMSLPSGPGASAYNTSTAPQPTNTEQDSAERVGSSSSAHDTMLGSERDNNPGASSTSVDTTRSQPQAARPSLLSLASMAQRVGSQFRPTSQTGIKNPSHSTHIWAGQ